MELEKLVELLPILKRKEIDFIKKNFLNDYFHLHKVSKETFFIPKKGSLYLIKEGGIIVFGYINDLLEFNLEFDVNECVGLGDMFHEKKIDLMMKGKSEATILEIPLRKIKEKQNKEVLFSLYEKLIVKIVANKIKVIENYAAKMTLSNDQYLIQFLLNNNGTFTFDTIGDFAYILHIELRTLQRLIKKLTSQGIIQKSKKTIKIIDKETAKKILNGIQ